MPHAYTCLLIVFANFLLLMNLIWLQVWHDVTNIGFETIEYYSQKFQLPTSALQCFASTV